MYTNEVKMSNQKVFYAGTARSIFRPHEFAEIIGVEWVTPDGHDGRACFRVRYADGFEDVCQISDTDNYQLAGPCDVRQSLTVAG